MDFQLSDVEELTVCSFCKQKFNDTDLCPKVLQCRHYFCLKCIDTAMIKGKELFCVYCWKRTEINDGGAQELQTHSPTLALTNHLLTLKSNNEKNDKLNDKKVSHNDTCLVHGLSYTLWCHTCHAPLCRICLFRSDHPGHFIQPQSEAREQQVAEVQSELLSMNKIIQEIQKLTTLQKEFSFKVLEACVTLKTLIESDIQLGFPTPEINEVKDLLIKARAGLLTIDTPLDAQNVFTNISNEKQRLELKYHELLLQCKLDDLIANSSIILDFTLLGHAVATLQNGDYALSRRSSLLQNPILFLTNYCMSQLYSRYIQRNNSEVPEFKFNSNEHDWLKNMDPAKVDVYQNLIFNSKGDNKLKKMDIMIPLYTSPPVLRNSLYYFNIDLNNSSFGRIVIETRFDLAPKMSKNFEALCTGETGVSYKNCCIFQCWEGESIITGDYELNNGRGGRSIFEDGFFMPDETKIPAVRGAVGMRRTQKRHDNLGMVGSQFRVILQEMRGFTAIFGHVIEGLDIIEKIASFGDQTGKPTKSVVITDCGKL